MKWRTRIVLVFARFRKPINVDGDNDVAELRIKASKAAKLGTLLFDRQETVASIIDVEVNNISLRIYKNSDKENQRVIIYYHGGGFVLYDLNSHENVCKRLCKMNDCIVVSVDYKLAPEHTYPKAHQDALDSVVWVRNNIAEFGGNGNDLVVAGDSAGGNLAACMAHRCKQESIALKAQILIYPFIDGKLCNSSIERNGTGFLLEKQSVFWFQKQYTPSEEDRCRPHVSPCYESDFDNLAPAFILTAEYDPLVDDGFNYAQQLEKAGNKVLYKMYPKLIHGFINVPQIDENAMGAFEDIRQFLKSV